MTKELYGLEWNHVIGRVTLIKTVRRTDYTKEIIMETAPFETRDERIKLMKVWTRKYNLQWAAALHYFIVELEDNELMDNINLPENIPFHDDERTQKNKRPKADHTNRSAYGFKY